MLVSFKDKILARRVGSSNVTSHGVIKTSEGKEKPLEIEIISSSIENVSPGDRFLIARYSGIEFEYLETDLIVVVEDDIIARIEVTK